MKTVVIGATGHVGSYLVPRLLAAGHDVVAVSRGTREPYTATPMWNWVERVQLDRDTEEAAGTFGKKIAALKGDVVVDLISFEPKSTISLIEAIRDDVQHYLYCASIWCHGSASVVPATEDLPRFPICNYGRNKAATEAWLHEQYRTSGLPETVVMPGHITGPGWNCINPCGNFDARVWGKVVRGEQITLPNFGMECLHHVHADDVAQVFANAISHRQQALGESFHAVAPAAITLKGLAEAMYQAFGHKGEVAFLPWEEWCAQVDDPAFIKSTSSHLLHSDSYSCEKARRLIDYMPRYSIVQACTECVEWLIANGQLPQA